MELKSIKDVQKAEGFGLNDLIKLIGAITFILLVIWYVSTLSNDLPNKNILIITAIFGGYMAINIGANDVANNVSPAVGAQAITIFGAVIIAAIFEAAGSLIAGGDVVGTIKNGIIDPKMIQDTNTFIWLMMAALLAGAIWLNLATAFGAPVSTTHAIVGGVAGAGIAAAGFDVVNWAKMGEIVFSWMISPFLGGIVAAGFLYFLKQRVIYQDNMQEAAQKVVPWMIAIMTWSFGTYIILKGAKQLIKVDFITASAISFVLAIMTYFAVKASIKKTDKLESTRASVNKYFNIPLIFSAALLSFAHGANDVANAVGPLAGIYDALTTGHISSAAGIPIWVMLLGASGIVVGLGLYGPRLIKTVGSEITELDQIRAFCVAMSAALTVIIASQMGLPVSSTHIAVGAVFGVGFLREYLLRDHTKLTEEELKQHKLDDEMQKLEEYKHSLESLGKLKKVDPILVKTLMGKINEEKAIISHIYEGELELSKVEKKALKAVRKHELVKRSALKMILAAWLITVPASALLAAIFYFMIRGMLL
ncbi:inorganic phosphate transporter [Sulfurospirillum multivorans]|uniref:Phosphate transporter n=2 Tax=Sulfurospirillum multivorans TaxID=66821 RepID=A0AA86AN60_SULMK|nr:inorganic phosphate transporter [Sulfurospirillum multivorans]AHJ13821.1 putative phosphate permease [Sulfurospirillum multivorans DSM 12446]QEH07311.1 putative phosphate permease [Sulfurospirillum multivorans]